MPRPFLSGLRGRLLLLVALAVLPAFALTFYAGWRDRQHQLAGIADNTVRLARLVASDQERIIEGTRQILSDLAEVPEIREGDGAKSRQFFALLMKQYRGYASFSVLDPAGKMLVSLPAPDGPLNLGDRTWFQQALSEKEFVLGGYQIGQLTHKPVLVAAWPVKDGAGEVVSVIAAALDIEWLNHVAGTTQLPAGATLLVLDRQERIVARYPHAPQWIGRTVPEAEVLAGVRRTPEGLVEALALDGVPHIYGFTPIRGRVETGLRLVVGIPRNDAYGAITQAQNRQILALVLVAVLTLAAAWFGAERFVLRRVASLLEATRKLAAGDPAARTRLPYGHGELSDLARAFDEMAGAIQARQSERDRAEQALRESEERFRAFMNHSPAIAFVKDQAGRYLYANAAFERCLALDADAWFGRTDSELWAAETAHRLHTVDREVLESGQPRQEVEALHLADGREAHWFSVTFPLTDASGRRLLAGTCVDLTGWRQLQEALGQSERRYGQLVEQASDGIVLTDPSRRMVAVNSSLAALWGGTVEELQQLRLDDLLVPGTLTALAGGLDDLPAGGSVSSACVVRRRDGATFPAEISARVLENHAVQAFVRDVTARQQAEEALRASEERFRRLYHYLPIAYQSLALDGTIVEVNDAWVRLMDLPRERALGTRFAAMLPAASRARFEESLANLSASEELHGVEFTVVRERRAAVIVSVDGRTGQDERGETRVHCVLHDVTAERVATARLAQSEERFRTLFHESPISLWEEDFSGIKRHIERLAQLGVADLAAHFSAHPEELDDCVEAVRVVDINKATLALYGADTRSQLLAGLDQVIGADGHEVFKDAILALARGERSWESEGLNYTLAGEPIRLALRWSLAPGAEASWSRVLVSAMDVTERRRAESALRESELRLERTFRSAPGLMAVTTGREGRYLEVNDAFLRELGFERGEVIGRTPAELCLWVDPGQQKVLRAQLEADGSVENQEIRLRRKGGEVMEGLCSIVPLVVEGEDSLLVHVLDRTARKRAEDADRESRRMLATLMSNLPGMVYQCCDDSRWTMLFVSEGCRELTGYEPQDLVGNRVVSYEALILEEDREAVLAEVQEAIAAQRAFRMVYRIRRADGDVRWVWEQGRAVPASDGQATTIEGFIADITDRRRAEDELKQSAEQLRHAQKMEAVGRLAGGVAHDFNNLLTAILGYSDLLLAQLEPASPLRPRVEEIRKAGDRAANLTRQLLAFSRKQVLTPEVLALDSVLADMTPMMQHVIGEDIELRFRPGLTGRIKADPAQIEQVLLNLVVNGRDAMPRGGVLTIETSRVKLDERDVKGRPGITPDVYGLLSISDTGVGMDEDARSHLFEPFYTTKGRAGTGLGLSTVYGIVQQSGGFILVDSEMGRGTRFRIHLPLVAEEAGTQAQASSSPDSFAGSETVLVAEDEESVRRLIRAILERHGYRVLEAADGEQALAVWEAAAGRIDLLITDVVMPRVDGLALVSRIRATSPGARVVYLSGYNDEAILRHGQLSPGAPLLQKPFASRLLMRTVRQVLGVAGES